MVPNTKGSSWKVCDKVEGDLHPQTMTSMKVSGKRTKQMDMVRNTLSYQLTRGNGRMILKMVKAKKNGLMGINTKVITSTGRNTAMGYSSGSMGRNMRGSSRKELSLDMERWCIRMGNDMKVSLKMENSMEKGVLHGRIRSNIPGSM